MAARRTTDASSFSGPNGTFMRYVQNPVFNFVQPDADRRVAEI
jgi:hypothetical protein